MTHDPLLTRRQLLARGALAGGAALLAGSSCATSPVGRSSVPASKAKPQPPELPGAALVEVPIAKLRRGMEQGQWSAREITELYLQRIEALDRRGPALRAYIEVNPDAVAIADRLDRERRDGKTRGALHGIPIALKDNIATADRMTTTAGSLALKGSIPPQDAHVARRLREAGAILIGKANMSEWANFRSNRSTSGWSARGGQCRSPYALDRNPCGSSSGSAVATAASMAAAAVGTETDGSIICPSSANGLVGLKPTVGLVSRSWIIPISVSQDTAGPMGRTVRDVAILLSAMIGSDPADAATAAARKHGHQDYTRFLDPAGLKGTRIGVARELCGFHDEVDVLFEKAVATMRRLGAEIIDPAPKHAHKRLRKPEMELLLYEFKAGLNAYLKSLGDRAPVRSLAEVIRFNREHHDQELRFFGQDLLLKAQRKGPLTEQAYLEALATARRLARDQGIDAALAARRLDAIVAPSGGPAWKIDLVTGDHFLGGSSSAAAVAGYPNITVPAGQVHGLPIGISIFGGAWREPEILRIAYAYEQATRHRRPPGLRPSVGYG